MTENSPASMSESDERLWGSLAHGGVAFFSFLPGLIIWLVQKDKSSFVETEAKESLNFGILVAIGYIVSSILTVILIGFVLWLAVFVVALIFGIKGAMANQKGEAYRYPFNWRLVK